MAVITNLAKGTMPEQVQENKENIEKLQQKVGKMVGKNLWTNPNPTTEVGAMVIPSDEFLNPYNVIKLYFIVDKNAGKLSIVSINLDLDVNYPISVFHHDLDSFARRDIEFNSLQNEIKISNDVITNVVEASETSGVGDTLIPLAAIGFIEDVTE